MATRLQQEVWALYRCAGCGACVAACSKGVLYWGDQQHPLLEERRKEIGLTKMKLVTCEVCQRFCELSCPRLEDGMGMVARQMVSARATGPVRGGAPDEVIQGLLVGALSAGLIDGVIMPDVDPLTLVPYARVATTVSEVTAGLGMQYLWVPLLDALNEAIFGLGLRRVAVVGPPCVAEGARKLANAPNDRLFPYRDAIRLTVSHFCTGVYMPDVVGEVLERGHGISRQQIRSLTTSVANDTLTASLWDGREVVLPLQEVEKFTRRGCGSCSDYTGESADLAVGLLGALPGFSTVISRTPGGDVVLQNARGMGLVETIDQVDTVKLDAGSGEKDRRERAQAFDDFRVLMLDALGDPARRTAARKSFTELYGVLRAGPARKEGCNVGCGGCG